MLKEPAAKSADWSVVLNLRITVKASYEIFGSAGRRGDCLGVPRNQTIAHHRIWFVSLISNIRRRCRLAAASINIRPAQR